MLIMKRCLEGRIEDIDILNEENIKVIQCKYHEAKEDYLTFTYF